MPCCAVITLPPHQHQTDKPSQLEIYGGDRVRGCVSVSRTGCEITTVTSVCKEPKNWLKCSVNGQCHLPLLFCSSLPPTETSISRPSLTADLSAPHPLTSYSQQGLVQQEADSVAGGENSSYLSTWRPCQNVRPGDISRAAGLLAKETGRMVGAGACCHRPVKLPETGNQEALSLSLSLLIYLS